MPRHRAHPRCPALCAGGGTPTLESLSAKRELREKTKPTLRQHRGARWLRCQWEFGHQLQKHQISRDTDTNPGTCTLPPSGTGHLSRPPNLQPPTGVQDLRYPRAGQDAGRSRAVAERHSDVHRVSGMGTPRHSPQDRGSGSPSPTRQPCRNQGPPQPAPPGRPAHGIPGSAQRDLSDREPESMENVNLKQIWSIAYNWALIFTLRDKEALIIWLHFSQP